MGRRGMRSMVIAGVLLALGSARAQGPPMTPAACDPGVTSSTLGPAWLTDIPDLLCAWNAPYNTAAQGLHDHMCADDYACNLQSRGVNFASLGAPADGALRLCTDCTATNPCASGGSPVFARREGGAWNCGAAGSIYHVLNWYFAGTPSAGVQPARALVPLGGCVIVGAEISVNTTASSSTTWNIQRCADGTCTSPTNVFASNATLSSGAERAYPGTDANTIAAGDAFQVKFVTVGTGLADVAVALAYTCTQ